MSLKAKQSYVIFRQKLRIARQHNGFGSINRLRAFASFIYNVGRYVAPELEKCPRYYRRVLESLIEAIIEYSAYTTELDRLDCAPISRIVLDILNRSKDLRIKVPPEIYARAVTASKGFAFDERIYSKGSPYDFYKDFLDLVRTAECELTIVDAFASEDMLNLYLDQVEHGVNIRILTSRPKDNFITVAQKFKQKADVRFEVRQTTDIHDRFALVDDSCWVFGQSVKDAGLKPTYLLRIRNYQVMKAIFEGLWAGSSVRV